MLKLDLSNAQGFLPQDWLDRRLPALEQAHRQVLEGNGPGGDFTGWVTLPRDYDSAELVRIKAAAEKIRSDSDVLVVIGIGGSYLGARAVIELMSSADRRLVRGRPEIFFAGNGLSSDELAGIIDYLDGKDFSVNVISKSGTTTEPAVAFRIFKALLEEKYGKAGARGRIYATTDARKGALKGLADAEGYEEFVVPDAVGGRYSVLTAVGLLPIAAAGIDVDRLLSGAREVMEALAVPGRDNLAWQYAAARNALYDAGKAVELLVGYEPSFRFFAEWWKQLYGESEGKNGIGIFPASVEYNADLHSMGQYIQDGPRTLMETVVSFEQPQNEFTVPFAMGDPDRLNYLAGRKLSDISHMAQEAVKAAHIAGGVPNLEVRVPKRDEAGFAWLVCFFELACAISGYMSGVNPFDQPGVEAYKKNMFSLLGKPEAN